MARWQVAVVVLALGAIPGCSLDRTGLGVPARRDAHVDPIDAGWDAGTEPEDAGTEPEDAGTGPEVDAGVDAGLDAGTDAGTDAGPPPLRPCDQLYGGPGRVLCEERATECELNVQLMGSTCATMCASAGGMCVETYPDGDATHPCDRIGAAQGCDVTAGDQLCVCTRIP